MLLLPKERPYVRIPTLQSPNSAYNHWGSLIFQLHFQEHNVHFRRLTLAFVVPTQNPKKGEDWRVGPGCYVDCSGPTGKAATEVIKVNLP